MYFYPGSSYCWDLTQRSNYRPWLNGERRRGLKGITVKWHVTLIYKVPYTLYEHKAIENHIENHKDASSCRCPFAKKIN